MRIMPRLLARLKSKNHTTQTFQEKSFEQSYGETIQRPKRELTKPQTNDMLVLGEINQGTKKFENIQKNTGLNRKELNSILKGLEKRGLMKVEQKSGMFGPKVELYPTEKGLREFYS